MSQLTKFYLEVTVSAGLMERGFKLTEQKLNSVGEALASDADLDEIIVRPIVFATLKQRLEKFTKDFENLQLALKGLTNGT